jgi:hypothetical protein
LRTERVVVNSSSGESFSKVIHTFLRLAYFGEEHMMQPCAPLQKIL